jgi:serine/threonine protein kinase
VTLSDLALERLRTGASLPDFSQTRYEVVREIGRGGMGIVYEAVDRELGRPVALKVLAPGMVGADALERLRREARIMAGLEHPGIVPLHDLGTLPDGRVFYAMKLVGGARLDALLGEPRPRLLALVERLSEAVAFAHAQGVIHRDLKPENVMIGRFGEVLAMDWGVAKRLVEPDPPALGDVVLAAPSTAHGTVLGTPGYMAPEQERGEPQDARADIYALGGILYFVLTGEAPVRRGGTLLRPRVLDPGIPLRLEAVCLKALAEAPGDRYDSAQAFGADIARFLEGAGVAAFREGPWARLVRLGERHRGPLALIGAYIAMRLLLLAFFRV